MRYIIACFLITLAVGTCVVADTDQWAAPAQSSEASTTSASDNGMLPIAGDEASMGVVTPEFYLHRHETGNQVWAQKYQDLNKGLWAIGNLEVAGYKGPWQGYVRGWDFVTNNSFIQTEFGYTDRLWVQAYTDTVTRRIPLFPFSPVSEPGEALIPVLIEPFSVDDGQHDVRVSFRPVKSNDLTVVGDLWLQHLEGERPLQFRTRRGSVARPNGRKFETTQPVDSDNTIPSLGADFHLGTAAMSFRLSNQTYHNNAGGPLLTPDFNPAEPIITSRFTDTTNHSDTLKMSIPLGPKLSATGSWVHRERSHQTTGLALSDLGTLVPSNVDASIRSAAGALRYTPLTNLLFTAKFRDYNYDKSAPEIISGGVTQNTSVNRHEREWYGDSTFTGLRKTMLRGSYALRDIDRQDVLDHEPVAVHEEWEHPALALDTTHHIIRFGATTYAISNLDMRLDWKHDAITNPTFHGTPGKVDEILGNATWSLGDSFSLYGDVRRAREDNADVPPATFFTVASLADPTQYTARREAEAGAQFYNRTTTINLGAYKSVGAKLTTDVNYMYDEVHSRAYWILGTDPTFPPNIGGQGDLTGLPPELTPYDATDHIWSLGTTYVLRKGLSLRGNLLYGLTTGMTTTDSLFRLVAPIGDKPRDWQPISNRYWRAALGVQYKFENGQQVLFEYSRNNWNDRIENQFDGNVDYFTFALQTPF